MKTLLFTLFFSLNVFAVAPDFAEETKEFRKNLEAMVKLDTSNPPGNEGRIAQYVGGILKEAGIKYEIVDFEPGRQNIIARLKGSGEMKPLLLLAHIDVVGTENQVWSSDPHSVVEKNGYLIGRGVSDDLGMAVANLRIFLLLKKFGTALKRDVIFALTGDEESGGLGIRTVLEKRPELVNAEIALNEGGGIELDESGNLRLVSLNLAEKTYQDFLLTAKGTTGHSSVPLPDNAIYALSRALEKLGNYDPEPRLLPVTREYFSRRAEFEPARLAKAMGAIAASKGKIPKGALNELKDQPSLSASLRTTCVATLLSGGTRVNALPAEATANVNCRILPDESLDTVKKRLEKIIQDPKITVTALKDFDQGGASPTEGEVPDAVQWASTKFLKGISVVPALSKGASDSRFLRMKGIKAYGINPIAMKESDSRRAHGIDERILVSSIHPGLEFWYGLVTHLAAK